MDLDTDETLGVFMLAFLGVLFNIFFGCKIYVPPRTQDPENLSEGQDR